MTPRPKRPISRHSPSSCSPLTTRRARRLRIFGLTRIGEFADLARSAVIARFGEHGGTLHDLARGMDGRILRPRKPIERLRAEAELEPPVDNVEPLRFVLRNLCGALCEQLNARGAGATSATLVLDLETGGRLQLDQVLPEPAAVPDLLERLLVARLEASPPTSAVERLALELRGEQSVSGQQLGLFAPQLARAARLDWQLTGLALRFGADRLLRARIVDPEATVPEARVTWTPATADPMSSSHVTRIGPVTRLIGHHPQINVELDGVGQPCVLRWDGGAEAVEVCNQWRIEEAWWRRPVSRDYYKLAGQRMLALVYLDRVDGTWHLERVYD